MPAIPLPNLQNGVNLEVVGLRLSQDDLWEECVNSGGFHEKKKSGAGDI